MLDLYLDVRLATLPFSVELIQNGSTDRMGGCFIELQLFHHISFPSSNSLALRTAEAECWCLRDEVYSPSENPDGFWFEAVVRDGISCRRVGAQCSSQSRCARRHRDCAVAARQRSSRTSAADRSTRILHASESPMRSAAVSCTSR